ncbi:acetyl-coenzyme A synthetase N-terminal domain-containing protein, partial [Pelagimonas varians]
MYAQSMSDPDGFWGAQAERLDWVKKPTQVK